MSTEQADQGSQEQQATLGPWDAISIIVGIVIGTSIFKVPNLIFLSTSDPWAGLSVWLIGGVLALVGALCYAELATTYPRAGGDYYYQTRAFGPWMGFLFGWAQLVVVFTASIGAMAFVFGEYATELFDLGDALDLTQLNQSLGNIGLTSRAIYAAGAVLIITILNVVGVVFGKTTQNILTIAKIISLLGILIAGFGWAESTPADWKTDAGSFNIGILAMILVLYAYGGWNDAAFVAAEVRDPRRNIPRALILGVSLITVVYLIVNVAYLMGLGFAGARDMSSPVPTRLLEKAFPGWGGRGMDILVMISALGAVNGLTFTGARIYATMGNDYALFGWLGHWKPGRSAPVLALIAQGVITLGMIFTLGTARGNELVNDVLAQVGITPAEGWERDPFSALVNHAAPIFWVLFMLTGIALFLLRERDRHITRPFSVPLYPWLPIIFVNTCAFMLYQSSIYVGWRALFFVGLVLLGIPLYVVAMVFGGYRGDARKP